MSTTLIPITKNVGTQEAGETDTGLVSRTPVGRPFSSLVNQLVFVLDGANTEPVYVNYGNYPGLDANATVLILPAITSGQFCLPDGPPLVGGQIDPNQYYVSVSGNAGFVVVYAVYAT
jgi:hypothetical protein